jgi:hypothetical protein
MNLAFHLHETHKIRRDRFAKPVLDRSIAMTEFA